MPLTTFVGASVILPDGIAETTVTLSDGVIAAVGDTPQGDIIDARGLTLAPALIDLHGDAFEKQLMPRAGVFFPLDTALMESDRQLAANGIATGYHAISLGWEPGLRDVARGREIMETLIALAPRLTVDNRVQIRWETFAFEALDVIDWALDSPLKPAIAFNDHTSMTAQAHGLTMDGTDVTAPDFSIDALSVEATRKRTAKKSHRAGLDEDAYGALLRQVWSRRPEVAATIEQVAAKGRTAGVPLLSHDDSRAETRRHFHDLGSRVSEFPMTLEAAQAARDAGDLIVFGAPNAMRGGSHVGSLGAGDMVEAGLCDVLASDYAYPAMLAAITRLDGEARAPRHTLWSLVSNGPARAMGLSDRGTIAPGQRADLVLLDWPAKGPAAVRETWVAGQPAYRAQPRP